jgi:hypothetical protein
LQNLKTEWLLSIGLFNWENSSEIILRDHFKTKFEEHQRTYELREFNLFQKMHLFGQHFSKLIERSFFESNANDHFYFKHSCLLFLLLQRTVTFMLRFSTFFIQSLLQNHSLSSWFNMRSPFYSKTWRFILWVLFRASSKFLSKSCT